MHVWRTHETKQQQIDSWTSTLRKCFPVTQSVARLQDICERTWHYPPLLYERLPRDIRLVLALVEEPVLQSLFVVGNTRRLLRSHKRESTSTTRGFEP